MGIFGPNLDDLREPDKWPWPTYTDAEVAHTTGFLEGHKLGIAAERKRGDTYKPRALALLKQVRKVRGWYVFNLKENTRAVNSMAATCRLRWAERDAARAQLAAAEAARAEAVEQAEAAAAENAKLRGLLELAAEICDERAIMEIEDRNNEGYSAAKFCYDAILALSAPPVTEQGDGA